jgi:hypothetical protein
MDELKQAKVIAIAKDANIITKDIWKITDEKLGKRNAAAHASSAIIGQIQADAFIDDLVKTACSRSPSAALSSSLTHSKSRSHPLPYSPVTPVQTLLPLGAAGRRNRTDNLPTDCGLSHQTEIPQNTTGNLSRMDTQY